MTTGDEACDDGNDDNADGCTTECEMAACGDGYVFDGMEACDDGNDDNTDGCLDTCEVAACGDGYVYEGMEACDDANDDNTDECLDTCVAASCGDGFVWTDNEDCDDENDDNTDDCIDTCVAATCGDGYVWEGNEGCDDANDDEGDGCLSSCVVGGLSCNAIHDSDPDLPSGLYFIDPDGEDGEEAFEVFCDMETDGGGWTLILNRGVDSDNNGQPDLDQTLGEFDAPRATNWQYNIDLFWADTTEVVFADKENADCEDCVIGDYDSAIKVDRPGANAWDRTCNASGTQVTYDKLVGPEPNGDQAYQCGATLGWGNCGGNVCHYGTHSFSTASDGSWSGNQETEMHFPSAYSSYRSYGNVDNPPTAWCRSCGGGLATIFNESNTCCQVFQQFNARSRWTIWVR